ncbi:MAG: hypothetical protein A2091_01860 [Desulfuromonadales bacterium GWD2_61_12]|nr:MAG: hypothetical protein A2005_06045 [Desulfuromonadales bacterium GWC2_61_20]OGR35726.1 MAG: hypothetical protein A2091_01860 [Desulfuromonadales bacterium GWD2_61_12]
MLLLRNLERKGRFSISTVLLIENVEYDLSLRIGTIFGFCTHGSGFGDLVSCELNVHLPSKDQFDAFLSDNSYEIGSVHFVTTTCYGFAKGCYIFEKFSTTMASASDSLLLARLLDYKRLSYDYDPEAPPLETGLDPQLTFDKLHTYHPMSFAYAVGRAVAENPGQAYNPVLLFGATGHGKSTLLHAIGNAILISRPDARVVLTSGRHLIQDTRSGFVSTRNRYIERLSEVDVLLFDNLPDLAGKEEAEHAFSFVLSSLLEEGKQVVITSDLLPEKIFGLDSRIRRCLESCEIADFDQYNSLRFREMDLAKIANAMGLNPHEDIIWLLAQNLHTKTEMERCCRWLAARARLVDAKVGMDLARDYIARFVTSGRQDD